MKKFKRNLNIANGKGVNRQQNLSKPYNFVTITWPFIYHYIVGDSFIKHYCILLPIHLWHATMYPTLFRYGCLIYAQRERWWNEINLFCLYHAIEYTEYDSYLQQFLLAQAKVVLVNPSKLQTIIILRIIVNPLNLISK